MSTTLHAVYAPNPLEEHRQRPAVHRVSLFLKMRSLATQSPAKASTNRSNPSLVGTRELHVLVCIHEHRTNVIQWLLGPAFLPTFTALVENSSNPHDGSIENASQFSLEPMGIRAASQFLGSFCSESPVKFENDAGKKLKQPV